MGAARFDTVALDTIAGFDRIGDCIGRLLHGEQIENARRVRQVGSLGHGSFAGEVKAVRVLYEQRRQIFGTHARPKTFKRLLAPGRDADVIIIDCDVALRLSGTNSFDHSGNHQLREKISPQIKIKNATYRGGLAECGP